MTRLHRAADAAVERWATLHLARVKALRKLERSTLMGTYTALQRACGEVLLGVLVRARVPGSRRYGALG